MSKIFKKPRSVFIVLAVAVVTSLVTGPSTYAHVVVKPAEVVTSGFQTFTISVPNEKDVATTEIKLVTPENLTYVTPTTKVGWQVVIDRENDDSPVRSLTWTGGTVEKGFRDEFTFAAQVPANATEIQWKAYQTYADGSVVAWDKVVTGDSHAEDDETSGPLSVTKVINVSTEAVQAGAIKEEFQAASVASQRATYLGISGIIVAGVSLIFVSTRKK